MSGFLRRLWAMMTKEAQQLRRDRMTFAMMFVMPIVQLVLFGFAINTDPKGLPAAIISYEQSSLSRALVSAIGNTGYFAFVKEPATEADANTLLQTGEVQFVLTIPRNLTRDVARGETPSVLIEADATDPATIGPALSAVNAAVSQTLAREMTGAFSRFQAGTPAVDVRLHRRYNPEGITRYNIVPGLLGIILTMTMVMMTALAVTREYERGTMENLLAMPVRPIEVMAGKIAPYVLIGTAQVLVVLIAAKVLFGVPFVGSPLVFTGAVVIFLTVNLAIGFTFSTIARNQLQAVQMSFFFLMPAILLSGFAFPFRGMPGWAQVIGELMPATHFIRIVRGVMLKGATLPQIGNEIAVMLFMLVIVVVVAISRYRVTLD
ncbi:ABC transporter permease [Aestuariivirga sp.]|uniref:ABC transporter permease n=1 Tax=Aestuariivirga sp. TaxID=2650926 RepID=UPI0039E2540B